MAFLASSSVLAVFFPGASRADAISAEAACRTYQPSWTALERAVWQQVCNRKRAVLAAGANTISADFLKAILLDEPYRSAIHSGVEIVNAHFTGPINFSGDVLATSLALDRARFDGPVDFDRVDMRELSMAGARFADAASFEDAKIAGAIKLQGASTKCIDLSGIDVTNGVFLNGVTATSGGRGCAAKYVHGDIQLIRARVGLDLDMSGAKTGGLSGSWASIHGAVKLTDGVFGSVNFDDARIGGTFDLSGSTAAAVDLVDIEAQGVLIGRNSGPNGYVGRVPKIGDISLYRAHLKSDFTIEGATAGAVDATNADIGGDVIVTHAHLGTVTMPSARIAGSCQFVDATTADVDAAASEIAKVLVFAEARAAIGPSFGNINVSGARLGTLALKKATTRTVTARNASIGHDVLIEDASMEALDLTSTRVEGNLLLISHKAPLFRGPLGLSLRNTSVRAFEDRPAGCPAFGPECPDPWPRGCGSADAADCTRLELNGFTYGTFAFVASAVGARTAGTPGTPSVPPRATTSEDGRSIDWWKDWLRRASFSPQPYRQLASVFQSLGRPEDAVAIEVAGKDRELETASLARKAFLLFDKLLVGYGYHPEYSVVWAALLVVAGLVVVLRSGQQAQLAQLRRDGEPMTVSALVYSFDTLLPVITLRKKDGDTEFEGWAGYYFFGQRLAGWVLASFLVAGVSGLTK